VWGRGYGAEAWRALCDHLFRARGIRKITAGTIEPNAGMIGIMKNVGMVDDGRRIRHHLWNGREVDVVYAALFRDDWLRKSRT
jgi:RimJ/RimL family protein N-acetyltransferase